MFLDFKVYIKDSYEVVQANNIYFQKVDTVSFHLMYNMTLAPFGTENMASYIVAVVGTIHTNLVKTLLMIISL